MKVIGLTGGIGSGKSTVSEYLKIKNISIIDADAISREIVISGSKMSALDELVNAFGSSILSNDGTLDRKKLASKAFSTKENKELLDTIMLGKIVSIILKRIEEAKMLDLMQVVIDAPLLFEADLAQYCDEIWVVDASDEVRINRVMSRDGATKEEVIARIKTQTTTEEKKLKATHILDNSTTKEALYNQIDEIL